MAVKLKETLLGTHRDGKTGINYIISELPLNRKSEKVFSLRAYSDKYHKGKRQIAHLWCDIDMDRGVAELHTARSYLAKGGSHSKVAEIMHRFLQGNSK